jgi:hypothetical protein
MFRTPARQNTSKQRVATVKTMGVPYRGWNTRDNEDPKYAPILTNWFLNDARIAVRNGWEDHVTGLNTASDVQTLMEYDAGGTQTLFAAHGTDIYDVTSAGAVGAAVVNSLTNAKWQYIMHATTSGQYLVAVNGADGVLTWSGAAWANQTITGATATNFIDVVAHKARLWFAEKQTMSVWYLATYAIAGAATELDIGPLCRHGGEVVKLATWSFDGGTGPDDYLVIITSQGEVVVYSGTDPSSSTTWALVGVYKVDKPLGNRCAVKFGGDVVVLTESGVVSLNEVRTKVDQRDSLSDPIRADFVSAASEGRALYGWGLHLYPTRGWLIANIPRVYTDTFDQFIYSTLHGAWFRFRDIPAICWQTVGDDLYFGGPNGIMAQGDTTRSDNGDDITAEVALAWSRFGTSQKKRFTMIRPNFFADEEPIPVIAMRTDYDPRAPTAEASPVQGGSGSLWDVDLWDVATWGGDPTPHAKWETVLGIGVVGAPRIKTASNEATIYLLSVDVAYEVGGIL